MNALIANRSMNDTTSTHPELDNPLKTTSRLQLQRTKVRRVCLGIVIALSVISPAHAQLSGTDLEAARAYITKYSWIPADKQNEILRKDNLNQVADYLKTNTFWDGSKNILLPAFDPAARMQTAITGSATMPMTSLVPAEPTLIKNDPTGTPTHQIGEATHLDGNHNTGQSFAAQRTALQQHAEEVAAYQHNDPTGTPTHQIGEATHLDGNHNTGQSLAAQQTALQQHTEEVAAYQHNDPTGTPTHQTGEAQHLDGNHNTGQSLAAQRTALQQHAEEVAAYQHNDPTGVPVNTTPSKNASDDEHVKQNPAEQASVSKQKPVVKQVVRSAYYDQQITALNAEAEQNHSEVMAESHSRAVADAQTLSQANDYTNKKFNNLKSEVDGNKKEAAAGSASAMAQANIPQVQESQQFAVGAGVGGYDSQNAISVGASFHASRATIVKMSVSDDSQSNFGYGAGVSVGW
ncbi:YadA-like family protein [Rahnella bonaserana]|nr:YadA-like family protein [Rahnella bonaserana]